MATNQKPPEITMHGVTSSQVKEIGHDPATNTLAVRFSHGGTLYHYASVDAMLIEDEFDITIEDSGYPISVIDLE